MKRRGQSIGAILPLSLLLFAGQISKALANGGHDRHAPQQEGFMQWVSAMPAFVIWLLVGVMLLIFAGGIAFLIMGSSEEPEEE